MKPKVGLVECQSVALFTEDGQSLSSITNRRALVSKLVLIPLVESAGFDVEFINLKSSDECHPIEELSWCGRTLTKSLIGTDCSDIDPDSCDVWGLTCNFTAEREAVLRTVTHLAQTGRPVVAGGSDAIADPDCYFQAGVTAVIQDKSGAGNRAVLDYLAGRDCDEELTGVRFADGREFARRRPPMSPQDWPVPSRETAAACMGSEHNYEIPGFAFNRIGSLVPDIGCDRKCDFCQTPTYGNGYKQMTPERLLQWAEVQKEAGAQAISMTSDQFLARVLWKGGREQILEACRGLRDMDLAFFWPNGLELRKATIGRGFNREGTDLRPDEELINALWGWDGGTGCGHAFIPAERPVTGREAYAKLLPWQEHCELMRAVVRAGVPVINYGVIIGLPDDDEAGMCHLEEAIIELYEDLSQINPELTFFANPFPLFPIPSTPQHYRLSDLGMIRYPDPAVLGGLWISCADTQHLKCEQVAQWQVRLSKLAWSHSKQLDASNMGRLDHYAASPITTGK